MNDVLASAMVGHLVGDFLLQNHWMATEKKKRFNIAGVHALIWALCVMGFAGWYGAQDLGYVSERVWFHGTPFFILFLSHWYIDGTDIVAFYMDSIGSHAWRVEAGAPWSGIVVDNTFHILTIWVVWKFFV